VSRARILYHYWQVRHGPATRLRSRAALEAWQERQVQRHLVRLLPRSAYTRQRLAGRAPSAWRQMAPMDKPEMLANFDALNTVGARWDEALALALEAERTRDFTPTLRGLTVGLSSGTSGTRGLFLASAAERDRWAGAALARLLPGGLAQPQRVAFCLRANSALYRTVGSRRLRFDYFDLLQPLAAHLARLNALQPTIIVGPPALLRLLAEAQAAGRLHIAPIKIIAVAEVLDPLDETYIAARFEQHVHQVYQCAEGFLGSTCRLGTLHLHEDLVVIEREWLDRGRRKFVPIVTDFHRTSQPILRYRLDDILTERAEPCACGSLLTVLEAIEGRCDDLFYLPGQSGGWVIVFPDFVSRALMSAGPALQGYVARQLAPDRIEVALAAPGAEWRLLEQAASQALAQLWERLAAQPPQVRFIEGGRPEVGGRKFKRVERVMPRPEGEARSS
jgi:putative adenylate-forming enzyme